MPQRHFSHVNTCMPFKADRLIEQLVWKTVWQFLKKTECQLPYAPAIALLGILPREMKTYVYTKTCTQIFIVALFIITKTWKQLRCPSIDAWISNLWYICTVDCHSVIKRNIRSSYERHGGTISA